MLYDIYLAGPFFTPLQKARMEEVKSILAEYNLRIADPQNLGPVIVELKEEEKSEALFCRIFQGNITALDNSYMMLASIDEKDTGTSFELGYFYSRTELMGPHQIVTFAFDAPKINVMLSQAVSHHIASRAELREFLSINRDNIANANKLKFNSVRPATNE